MYGTGHDDGRADLFSSSFEIRDCSFFDFKRIELAKDMVSRDLKSGRKFKFTGGCF